MLALVEPTLAQDLGVSRPSVREGLVRLEAEGFIRRRKGAGTVVNPGALEMLARFDQQVEFADLLRQAGFEPTVELLDAATVPLAERERHPPGRPRPRGRAVRAGAVAHR